METNGVRFTGVKATGVVFRAADGGADPSVDARWAIISAIDSLG